MAVSIDTQLEYKLVDFKKNFAARFIVTVKRFSYVLNCKVYNSGALKAKKYSVNKTSNKMSCADQF